MTKIIFVGDIHLSDRPPLNATESYTDDILNMLSWIAQYEKDSDADAVVWLGDIFHHKQPGRNSHQLVLRAIEVVKQYRNLWGIVGNHDIMNDRLESARAKQPIGVLFESGLQELNGWHSHLPLYGIPWQQGWTTYPKVLEEAFADWNSRGAKQDGMDPRAKNYVENVMKMDLAHSVVATHAPVFPTNQPAIYDFIAAEDVADAMGNRGFFTYGHIHDRHGIWTEKGVQFSNLGSISRGSLTESNLSRAIQVSEWTPDKGFVAVDVPHKPASEVFRIAEATAAKEAKLSADQFLAEVGQSTLDISSTESVIAHVGSLPVEERVRKLAIEILESVEPS